MPGSHVTDLWTTTLSIGIHDTWVSRTHKEIAQRPASASTGNLRCKGSTKRAVRYDLDLIALAKGYQIGLWEIPETWSIVIHAGWIDGTLTGSAQSDLLLG